MFHLETSCEISFTVSNQSTVGFYAINYVQPLSHQGCDRAALRLRPQNHESAEVSAVKSPRMDR